MTINEFINLLICREDVSMTSILHYPEFNVVKINYGCSRIFNEEDICPLTEYYYISNNEVTKVEIIAQLRYDFASQPKEEALSDLFECLCCGEQIEDDGIRFLWFESIE